VAEDRITLGSGSQDLIDLIFKTYLRLGDEILTTDATYEWYATRASHYSATVVAVPTQDDFSVKTEDLLAAQNSKSRLIMIDSPSNPFGVVFSAASLRELARQTSALIVIDEEYVEFYGTGLLKEIDGLDNVIILRSFSKWAGLAGIRIGYAIAPAGITRRLVEQQLPHPVSSLSAHVAVRALDHAERILRFLPALNQSRDMLLDQLDRLGLWVWSQNTPYIVVRGDSDAVTRRIYDGLYQKGISTKLYEAKGVFFLRITIPPSHLTEILMKAIRTYARTTDS
jgi:histidinol-phosphate aminotransferase